MATHILFRGHLSSAPFLSSAAALIALSLTGCTPETIDGYFTMTPETPAASGQAPGAGPGAQSADPQQTAPGDDSNHGSTDGGGGSGSGGTDPVLGAGGTGTGDGGTGGTTDTGGTGGTGGTTDTGGTGGITDTGGTGGTGGT